MEELIEGISAKSEMEPEVLYGIKTGYSRLQKFIHPLVFAEVLGFDYALFSKFSQDGSLSTNLRSFLEKIIGILTEEKEGLDERSTKIFNEGILLYKSYQFHEVGFESERDLFYRNRMSVPLRYSSDPNSVEEDIQMLSTWEPTIHPLSEIDRSSYFEGLDI